uniref:Malto-oligosyltrehalose synthase n=1 Tax=Roseihalotalea indica TaxID=2867963 RepID=A0AA49GRZ6_9BACT|nr:malto-oligosyltrehalose synthase [Tunicatimonas sp. TK19036]
MYIPSATYRLQFHKDFTLAQAREQLDYLKTLGISTVYASPLFEARSGSTHGYDVINPEQINPEIGTLEDFEALTQELSSRHMGWLQDIVPNHMAFSTTNPWIQDILELGPHSKYFTHFDVNWWNSHPENYGKLMMPILGDDLANVLAQDQIRLSYDDQGLALLYYEHRLPLKAESYQAILTPHVDKINQPEASAKVTAFLAQLDGFMQTMQEKKETKRWQSLKDQWQDMVFNTDVRTWLLPICEEYNTGNIDLANLLSEQYYRLTYWKDTEQEIYYRRFFTVNDLICLNMQEPQVFEDYHRFLRKLINNKQIQGVRVDHVDGLFDPTQYLEQLRAAVGPDTYIVVEKILEGQEQLPDVWPIQGSSGYEFLVQINRLFSSTVADEPLTTVYDEWMSDAHTYENLVYQNKMFILKKRMHGELTNLMALLESLEIIPEENVASPEELQEALAHLLVAFPVYRIYSNQYPFSDRSLEVLAEAFERAESHAPDLQSSFDTLRIIFNGVPDKSEEKNENTLYFIRRCQQFTGPLAAKGIEDTTFYQYNRLISRNEVGDSPDHLGATADEFHQWMQNRSLLSMNASATHDTKRGEDARMRINLLSEIADEWGKLCMEWRFEHEKFKSSHAGGNYPTQNDEYFLYQTLIGTYPFHISPIEDQYNERLKDYLLKAVREAKTNTSWSEPNEPYEKALEKFAVDILGDEAFMRSFQDFAHSVARRAVTYSLGQTVLKVMAPGIPDIYQGTEYWDLSMVDPDNRRPVDYASRKYQIDQFSQLENQLTTVRQLTKELDDPAIKMYTLHRSLQLRQQWPSLFEESMYQPLVVTGTHASRVLAFLRRHQDRFVITIIPREVVEILPEGQALPLGKIWADTAIAIPELPGDLWKNQFTGEILNTSSASLSLSAILHHFPVAILTNQLA